MIRLFFLFSMLMLLSCGEDKPVVCDVDGLKGYVSTIGINWTGNYVSDTQLIESFGPDMYKVSTLDTLQSMDCIVYEVESAMIRFLVLYDISKKKYSHIFTFPHFLSDSEMYTNNSFFYSDDDENLKGLEYYLNITSKPDSSIVSNEFRKLLSLYDSNLFSDDKLVSTYCALTDILDSNNITLCEKDIDLFNYIFVDQSLFISPRRRPLCFNVYYFGNGKFYVVGIFNETPTTLINNKFKTWVHVINGKKML